MAIRSGLGGQIGIAAETAYGTFAPPNTFLEATSKLSDTSKFIQSGGIAAGRMQQLTSRRVRTSFAAAGTIDALDVTTTSMGKLLQALMGTTVTPQQQATSGAYLQTHTLADPFGKSLTVQVGDPDVATGTVHPYNFLGCKILDAQFECKAGGVLTSTWTVDSRNVEETDVLAVASYPTSLMPFNFLQMAVKIGDTLADAAAVDGVLGATVKIDRASHVDRQYGGNAGLADEPVINNWQQITATVDADYIDKTAFADRAASGNPFAMVLQWTGPVIATTYNYQLTVNLPSCWVEPASQTLDGPDVLTNTWNISTGLDASGDLPAILYQSTDQTV